MRLFLDSHAMIWMQLTICGETRMLFKRLRERQL